MESVIGIDIGTTNIKAVAYGLHGERLAYASRKMLTYHPEPDYSEYNAEEIWGSVCLCLEKITSVVAADGIKAIGVASMAEAGVPIDSAGRPAYPVIAWFDPRTSVQADRWKNKLSEENIYSITGQFLHGKYGINKLMWIKQNRLECFEKTVKWLSIEDYIIFKLSGEFATDYSVASRTMAFDIVNCIWSDKILDAAGISKDLMPPAYPGGTMVGKVSGEAAARTRLRQGTPVITGGHDHACAAMAVKAFEPGIMLDSMGTAEATMIAVERPELSHESYMKALCIAPHCGRYKYRVITSIQACGASIEWLLSRFGGDIRQRSEAVNGNLYDMLMEGETKNSLPGASGLFFIPHIRGAMGYPDARGAFIGIKDSHGMGDFTRAIMEGLSYELRSRVCDLENIFGASFTTVRSVGGVTRSDLWMQTKADILGCEVEIPCEEEAASFGAAMLAAIGSGIFKDENDAAGHMYRQKKTFYPSGERAGWDKRFELYKQAIGVLMDIYSKY